MFDTLADRLQGALGDLRKRGTLDEEAISKAMREIRLALLEADVNFQVVRDFVARVRERAVGEEVRPSWFRWAVSLGLAVCVVGGIVGAILLVLAVPKASGVWEIPVDLVRWIGAIAALTLATGLLMRLAPAERRPKRWVSAGAVLVIATWLVTSIGFRWYVSSIANFKTAVGQLTVLIILLVYVYVSSIVFLVGVEVDELLREDARSDERGVLDVLFGLGR